MSSDNLAKAVRWRSRSTNVPLLRSLLFFWLLLPSAAQALPVLRTQVYQRGNMVWTGNTLAHDCATGVPTPTVGTIGACGANTSDSAPDIFFYADNPNAGQVNADANVTLTQARSTAVLKLPAGAQVTYARLYWGAENVLLTPGTTATFERPGTFSTTVTADTTAQAAYNTQYYYQSTVDVTTLVQTYGAGAYRIGNIQSVALPNRNDQSDYAGWALVVFYQLLTDPPRMLALSDNLDVVQVGIPAGGTWGQFLAPSSSLDATLWVLGYEGDATITGDALAFNASTLSDALNPASNFFNSTRGNLGAAVTVAGDLPQTSGVSASMSGIDIDAVNVASYVHANDVSAAMLASSLSDVYMLGAVGFSVTTVGPIINLAYTETNLTRTGAVKVGDVLQYTIAASNIGNDTATASLATALLPLGLSYVPNSLTVTNGSNSGVKTDSPLDDQAEYNLLTNTVTWRMGSGANALVGGNVLSTDPNQILTFQVMVNGLQGLLGLPITSQAVVTTIGQKAAAAGLLPVNFYSGNGSAPNVLTSVLIDNCATNSDCNATLPHCDTTVSPHVCTGCISNSECSGATPACNANTHVCVRCAANSDCPTGATCTNPNTCSVSAPTLSAPANGAVINTPAPAFIGSAPAGGNVKVYVDGVVAGAGVANANGTFNIASLQTLSAGSHAAVATVSVGSGAQTVLSPNSATDYFTLVSGCLSNSDCSGATPVCDTTAYACVQCLSTSQCATGATCTVSHQCTLGAPSISAPASGLVTNAATVTISGTSVPNANVAIAMDSASLASVTANASGVWTYTTAAPGAGSHTVSAVQSVGSGSTLVTSAASPSNTFTQVSGCLQNSDCSGTTPVCNTATHACVRCLATSDCPTTATCAGNVCTLAAPTLSGPGNGATINQPTAAISGTALAYNYVALSIDGGTAVTVQADSSGLFSYTPPTSLAPGAHTVTATAKAGSGSLAVTSPSASETYTVISGCLANSDCSGASPVCNTTSHACVRCTASANCPTGATCSSQSCVLATPTIALPANNALLTSTTPTLSGTSAPYVTVVASVDGAQVGTTTADANGNWSLTLPLPVTYATHTATVASTSGSGVLAVTSPASNSVVFSVVNCASSSDCANPKPVCVPSTHVCAVCNTTSDCSAGSTCQSQSCQVATATIATPLSNSTINQNLPIIGGTSAAGSHVIVSVDGALVGTVTADNANNWTITPTVALAGGNHVITATAAVSNAGVWLYAPSANANVTVVSGCLSASDCSTPTAVCNTASHACVACLATSDCPLYATCQSNTCQLAQPTVTSPAANAVTNIARPTFAGLATPNANVTIMVDGVAVATTQADNAGHYSVVPTGVVAAGVHTATATVAVTESGMGLTGPPSASTTFTSIVGCLANADCSGTTPVCQVSTHVCLQCASSSDCPTGATCGGGGTCAIATPTVLAPIAGVTLNQNLPTVSGIAIPNSTVALSLDGNPWATTTANSSGLFTYTPTTGVANGNHQVQATASLAGNGFTVTSTPSANSNFLLVSGCLSAGDCGGATPACNSNTYQCVRCLTAADCPTGAACSNALTCTLASPVILGPLGGAVLNQQPLVTGTSAPGATVTLLVDGASNAVTVADANGQWMLTPTPALGVGTHTLTAQSTSGAGATAVTSVAGPGVSLTLVSGCLLNSDCSGATPSCRISDHTCVRCLTSGDCPFASTCTASACTLSAPLVLTPVSGSTVNTNTVVVSGTAPASAAVAVSVDGALAGTVVADNLGHWSYTTTGNLSAGSHSVSAVDSGGSGVLQVLSPTSTTSTFTRVVGCLSSADCSGGTPACNTGTNQCVRCVGNADCPLSAMCSAAVCQLATPAVTAPAANATTSSTRPALSGTAPAGTQVMVSLDGNAIGTVTADGGGAWSLVPPTALGVGTHQVSVAATSGWGPLQVTSPSSPTISFQVFSCVSNADCSAPSSTCDTTQHLCVDCVQTSDCSAPATCQAQACVLSAPAISSPLSGAMLNNPNTVISGACPPGSTVTVRDNGTALATMTCSGSGTFSMTLGSAMAAGINAISATAQVTHSGVTLTSPASSTVSFTYVMGCLMSSDCNGSLPVCQLGTNQCVRCLSNTDCPTTSTCQSNACTLPAPTLGLPADASLINIATPGISGTAPVGSTVAVMVDGNSIGTATANAQGNWLLTSPALALGTHVVNATASVGIGPLAVTSLVSTNHTFDRIAGCLSAADCNGATPQCVLATNVCVQCQASSDCPSGTTCASSACQLAAPSIALPASGAFVNARHDVVSGTTAPLARVNVLVDGVSVGTTTANSSGAWQTTMPVSLSNGAHALTATSSLANSNFTLISAASAPLNVTWVSGCLADGDCGGAQPYCVVATNVCVSCRSASDCPLAATCSASGACALAVPSIDAPAPATVTNNLQSQVSGTAPWGANVVVLLDGNATPAVTSDANTGAWTWTPATPLSAGVHTLAAFSKSGALASLASTPQTLTLVAGCLADVDCTGATPTCRTADHVCVRCNDFNDCPGAAACTNNTCNLPVPVVLTPAAGATLNNGLFDITGTAPVGATIVVSLDGMPDGTATADQNGAWSYTPGSSLGTGTHQVTAVAQLGTGALTINSPASLANTITIVSGCLLNADCGGSTPTCRLDTHVCVRCVGAADCPTGATCGTNNACALSTPAVTGPLANATITASQPTLTGTAPAGVSVQLTFDGNALTTVTADANGNWAYTLASPVNLGAHQASATALTGPPGLQVISAVSNIVTFATVACNSGSDCSSNLPICDPVAHACAQCLVDNDCTVGGTCVAGRCGVLPPTIVTPLNNLVDNASYELVSGLAPAASAVALNLDGAYATTATAGLTGAWSAMVGPLPVGSHTLAATASIVQNGNQVTSSASNTVAFTTVSGCLSPNDCGPTAPLCRVADNVCVACLSNSDCPSGAGCQSNACLLAAPAVSAPADGSTLNTPQVLLSGTAVPGALVGAFVDGVAVATTTADTHGHWSVTPSTSFGPGNHIASAQATVSRNGLSVQSLSSSTHAFSIISGCLATSDCPSIAPVCRTDTHACVQCVAQGDCPQGASCIGSNTCLLGLPQIISPANGAVVNVAQPTLLGTAAPNATVLLNLDGNTCVIAVDGNGNWSRRLPHPLAVGTHALYASAQVIQGNVTVTSQATTPQSFTRIAGCLLNTDCSGATPVCRTADNTCVDCVTTADCPSGATCSAFVCGVGLPIILSNTLSGIEAQPVIQGTAAPSSVVDLIVDGSSNSQTTTDGFGNWSVPVASALSVGPHSVQAVNVVGSGAAQVTSGTSAAYAYTVLPSCHSDQGCIFPLARCDLTAHACVGCLVQADCSYGPLTCNVGTESCMLAPPVVLQPVNGGFVNLSTPLLSGTSAPMTTVSLNIDGNEVGNAAADANGVWQIVDPLALSGGNHTLTTSATSTIAGYSINSALSTPVTFDVIAGCLNANDCAGSASICRLSDNTCVGCLSSTDCPSSATCDTSVSRCLLPSPAITQPADGQLLRATSPQIAGTAPPNSAVSVVVDVGSNGNVAFSAYANAQGVWGATVPATLALGAHSVVATARSQSGNVTVTSLAGAPARFTIISGCLVDADCPSNLPQCDATINTCFECTDPTDCPSGATCTSNVCLLSTPVVQGPANGSVLSNATPLVYGTGVPGANVSVQVDGGSAITAPINSTGQWSLNVTPALGAGAHSALSRAYLQYGGMLLQSGAIASTFTTVNGCVQSSDCPATAPACRIMDYSCQRCIVDADCPTAATCVSNACILPPPTITTPVAAAVVSSTQPTIAGTGLPGQKITVSFDGNAIDNVFTDASGNFSLTPVDPLAVGGHSVTAVATAGVVPVTSAPSAAVNFTVAACVSNSDCSGATPVCGPSNVCVGCLASSDCAGGATCSGTNVCSIATPQITDPNAQMVTNDSTPLVEGTSVANAQVTVNIDGNTLGTTPSDGNGVWTFVPFDDLSVGSHILQVSASVGAASRLVRSHDSNQVLFYVVSGCLSAADCPSGNVCDANAHACVGCIGNGDCPQGATCSALQACILPPPAIVSPAENAVVNAQSWLVSGVAAALAQVVITMDNAVAPTWTVTADAQGQWSAPVPPPASGGRHALTAFAQSGGVKSASVVQHVSFVAGCLSSSDCGGTTPICDTTANTCVACLKNLDCPFTSTCATGVEPSCFTIGFSGCTARTCNLAVPRILQPASGAVTASKSGLWSGLATPGVLVTLNVDGGNTTGTATADANGAWKVNLGSTLTLGTHTALATATAGVSPDVVHSGNSFLTTVQVVNGCVANADCQPVAPWCDPNAVCAQCLVDAHCTPGAQCMGEICVTPTPVVVAPGDGAITVSPVLTVGGTAVLGSQVVLAIDGYPVATCPTDARGIWTCSPSATFTVGDHIISAVASVGAGQTLTLSLSATPHILHIIAGCLSSDDCSGAAPFCDAATHTCQRCLSNTDCPSGSSCQSGTCALSPPVIATPDDHSVTPSAQPVIAGTGAAGGNVNLYVDGAMVVTLPIPLTSGGNWTYTPTTGLAFGPHTAYATNTVGADDITVTSNPSPVTSFRVTTACSSASQCYGLTPLCTPDGVCARCLGFSDCPGVSSCNSSHECVMPTPVIVTPNTNDILVGTMPTFSGTATPGAVVQLRLDGNALGSVASSATGTWTYTPPQALALGAHAVTATAVLGSGVSQVTSVSSAPVPFTLIATCTDANACATTPQTPVCDATSGQCVPCSQDYNVSGAGCPFPSAPVCFGTSGCGVCTNAHDCIGAHAGPYCNLTTGACSPTCSDDSECGMGQACAAGVCTNLQANGSPIPGGYTCEASIAIRFCASGVCDMDNRCGLANGRSCADAYECRSDACDGDGRCGFINGDTCASDTSCRSGVCASDGKCGSLPAAACTAAVTCRDAVCSSADNECGLANGTGCTNDVSCRSEICADDDSLCGLPLGAPCTTAPSCRTSICANGICSQHCSVDEQCSDTTYCDNSQGRCLVDVGLGQACARNSQCMTGVCGTDGRCGAIIGQACQTTSQCRSGACVDGTCDTVCDPNGACGSGTYCNDQNYCVPTVANNAPCSDGNMCTSAVCGTDGNCGAIDRAPCAVPANCRSGICSANKRCSASCGSDADCGAAQYCDPNRACEPAQPNLSPCSADDQCLTGTCSPEELCGISNGSPCQSPNACQSGTCAADNLCGWPDGHACSDGSGCRTGACNGGVCSPCDADEQCYRPNNSCDYGSGMCKLSVVVPKFTMAGDGSNCAQASVSPWVLLAMLGAWAYWRRLRTACRAAVLVSALLSTRQARAATQEVVLQRNIISATNERTFWITRPFYAPGKPIWNFGFAFNYAHDPLMLGVWHGSTFVPWRAVLSDQFIVGLIPSVSFGGRWSITLRVPMAMYQRGNDLANVVPSPAFTFADSSVRGMVRLVGEPELDPISVHLAVQVGMAVDRATLSHPGNLGFTPRVIFAGKVLHQITWSAVVGVWFRHGRVLGSAPDSPEAFRNELQVGGAIGWETRDGKWHVGPEVTAMTNTTSGQAFIRAGTAAELLLGAHYMPTEQVHTGLAVGRGVLSQQGTPDWRVMAVASFSTAPDRKRPPQGVKPEMGVHTADAEVIACAPVPCTPAPAAAPQSADMLVPPPQTPPLKTPAQEAPVLVAPPSVVAAADPNAGPCTVHAPPGCNKQVLVILNEGSSEAMVPAGSDKLPLVKEAPLPSAPPPQAPPEPAPPAQTPPTAGVVPVPRPVPAVSDEEERVLTSQRLHYAPDDFALGPRNVEVLKTVRAFLLAHPKLHICIDGHTDSSGSAQENRVLSMHRATTARDWLVRHGIDINRVSAHGYSFIDPVATNDTVAGKAENRRVLFTLCQ